MNTVTKGWTDFISCFFFTSNVRLLACPNLNVKSTWSGIKWLKSVLIWGKKNVIKFRWIKSDVQLWSHYLTLLSEVWCQIVIFKSKQIFWKSKRISIITFNSNVLWKKVHENFPLSFDPFLPRLMLFPWVRSLHLTSNGLWRISEW